MCTTNVPGITTGNTCVMWCRMSSGICETMARGSTTYPSCIRIPRSRPLSSKWLLRHKPNSPRECTNLVWADLASPPLDACQQARADVTQDGHITPADALCIFQTFLGLQSCLH